MDVLFDRVAGLDIGKASVTVCVRTPAPAGKRVSQTRTFKTMTRSLEVMRDWLLDEGVQLAGMESTAKITSVSAIRQITMNSGVAIFFPFSTVQKFSPS